MRYVGIDIGADKHVVGVIDDEGVVVTKATPFAEDIGGYQRLFELLGGAEDTLVVMEATGHYWQNLFGALVGSGFAVALVNPLRTQRFAEEDLLRAKTDSIDAVMLARFAREKRPAPTRIADEATLELRELVRMRDRYMQDLGDRVRQVHRLVDLGFPEFSRFVSDLGSALATTLLRKCPTAAEFRKQSARKLGELVYDGRHAVGVELARDLIETAKTSVGRHHGPTYKQQVEDLCEDIDTLRRRIRRIDHDLGDKVDRDEIAKLLKTIDGIGDNTAARIVAELGDPSDFKSAAALAAYVGVAPRVSQSGKRVPKHGSIHRFGDAKLRAKLWMPILTAVRKNAWLRAFYERLIERGKLPKVALTAAMRKMLTAIYSVAKNRRPFVPMLPAAAPATT